MGSEILTLNIQDFRSNDQDRKKAFIKDLKTAFTEIGFVIIKGHDVDAELQKDAYDKIDQFFKWPVDKKKTFFVEGCGGQRGYTSFGAEHSKDNPVGDLKEFFSVGPIVPEEYKKREVYPDNVPVQDIENFDKTLRNLFNKLNELGMDLLRAIAVIVEQDEEFFTPHVKYGNSKLRAINYPPLTGQEEKGAVRSAEHEDIDLITLLIGASNPGLQAKHKSGEWISIQTQPHEIVVNVGDMLQRLTNYRLVSTTHRVINPPKELANQTRYSMPFFLHPMEDMSLAALSTCVSEENPARETAITAGEYLEQRLIENGLKK